MLICCRSCAPSPSAAESLPDSRPNRRSAKRRSTSLRPDWSATFERSTGRLSSPVGGSGRLWFVWGRWRQCGSISAMAADRKSSRHGLEGSEGLGASALGLDLTGLDERLALSPEDAFVDAIRRSSWFGSFGRRVSNTMGSTLDLLKRLVNCFQEGDRAPARPAGGRRTGSDSSAPGLKRGHGAEVTSSDLRLSEGVTR